MTREELREHCKKQIEGCEMWARYKGEEPHGKVYEEHKLILELLEHEPTKNDLGVDCISRAYLYNRIKEIDHDEDYECDEYGEISITYRTCDWDDVLREIEDAPSVTPISKECIDCIAEDKTLDKMDRIKQLLNSDKFDDLEVLKKIKEVVEE